MAIENQDSNVLLDAQLAVMFDTHEFKEKEDILTYSMNSVLLSASEILEELHAERFNERAHNEGTLDFDRLEGPLRDIIMYLFSTLNQVEVDTPSYTEVIKCKEEMPMILRTDKTLSLVSLIGASTELIEIIWSDLDSGLSTIGQAELTQKKSPDNKVDTEEENLEEDIRDCACHILAVVDTLCYHYGSKLINIL